MYLILELSGSDDWPTAPGGGRRIPAIRQATVLQPSQETAEREAVRLAAEHPDRRFVVFKAVAAGISCPVPTHITLSGQVIASRPAAKLVAIDDPEQPPF